MTAVAGYASLVKNSTNNLATVTSAELDITPDMLETSVINGGRAKTYIPGMYGGKFSCKMNWDASDTNGLLAFQTNATGASPSVIAFTLSPNGGTNNYTFNGWVSGIKPSAPVGGLVTADADVTITGSISYS